MGSTCAERLAVAPRLPSCVHQACLTVPLPPHSACRIAAWDRKCHRDRGLLTARSCSRRDRRSHNLVTAPARTSGYVAMREQLWQLIPVQEDNPYQWANILGSRVSVMVRVRACGWA